MKFGMLEYTETPYRHPPHRGMWIEIAYTAVLRKVLRDVIPRIGGMWIEIK